MSTRQLESYIDVGFDKKPTEEELKRVSEDISEILKIIKVKNYTSRSEVGENHYYSFYLMLNLKIEQDSLKELKKSGNLKMDPKLFISVYLPEVEERLKSKYKSVIHVDLGPRYAEILSISL